jgi:hypothetical protein
MHRTELRLILKDLARRVIPRRLITLAGFHRTFNRGFGHSKLVDGLAHDGEGRPIPWMTYPLIEFVRLLDLSDCHVFEFGAGSSTLFWSARSASVTSVEKDEAWYRRLAKQLPDNCTVSWHPHDTDYIEAIKRADKRYDIIVIDGAVRYPCAEAALNCLTGRGMFLLDNTEWYPETARMIRKAGFSQIDFSGFGPINAFPSTSSLFFRDPFLLSRRRTPDAWAPVGGHYLDAYDDKPIERIDPALID